MRRTAVYMRTHYWDEAIALSHARLQEATDGHAQLIADMTTPFDLPVEALPFTRQDFPALGLPLRPTPAKTLWYNGDYVFSLLAQASDAEAFLLLDGDCCLNGLDLPALLERLDDTDFCAPFVKTCGPGDWPHWSSLQRAWFDAELGPGHGAEVVKSFFPFVLMSRPAVEHVHKRRVEMARFKAGGASAVWPQCESVAPSELARAGFRLATLEDHLPGPMHMTFVRPLSPAEVATSPALLIHPVLTGPRLGRKIVEGVLKDAPSDPARQRALLDQALTRDLDAQALQVLQEARATLD